MACHKDRANRNGELSRQILPNSKEEILHRAHERLQRDIKGRKDFKITRAEPYWLHQRCAAQARKGRVLLAGDALHVSSRSCKTTLVC